MTDFGEFLPGSQPNNDTRQLLLGYPCAPGQEAAVVELLTNMTDEQRNLTYDWVIFSLDALPYQAFDQVQNYHRSDRDRTNQAAQQATLDYLDSMGAWLEFVRTADSFPYLDYQQPADGIGEDFDHLRWSVEPGGAANQLLAEQVGYLQTEVAGRYRKFIMREKANFLLTADSIIRNLPFETQAAQNKRVQARAQELLGKLAPEFGALKQLLIDSGIDPETYEPMSR